MFTTMAPQAHAPRRCAKDHTVYRQLSFSNGGTNICPYSHNPLDEEPFRLGHATCRKIEELLRLNDALARASIFVVFIFIIHVLFAFERTHVDLSG